MLSSSSRVCQFESHHIICFLSFLWWFFSFLYEDAITCFDFVVFLLFFHRYRKGPLSQYSVKCITQIMLKYLSLLVAADIACLSFLNSDLCFFYRNNLVWMFIRCIWLCVWTLIYLLDNSHYDPEYIICLLDVFDYMFEFINVQQVYETHPSKDMFSKLKKMTLKERIEYRTCTLVNKS